MSPDIRRASFEQDGGSRYIGSCVEVDELVRENMQVIQIYNRQCEHNWTAKIKFARYTRLDSPKGEI